MSKAKKMGRPKIPAASRRGRLISARFTEAELKSIKKAVEASGHSQSDWMREVLLGAAAKLNG